MFMKQPSNHQSRSVSNISSHYSPPHRIPASTTINALWDINQLTSELNCTDDPSLTMALEMIQNRQVNQALNLLHQLISEGKKYLGQLSQFQQVSQAVFLVVSSAMQLLQNDYSSALLLLLGCEAMLKGLTPKQQAYLRVHVQNGLGCYYRRMGQMDKALHELECALALIKKYALKEVAITHLNLSVVLSLIEEHDGALENAKKAVAESHKQYQHYLKNHVSISQFKFQRCICALAIAFYNVGVQEQYFQRYQQALQAYASAFKVAEDNLGAHNFLTTQLKNVYEEFARQLAMAEAQKLAIQSLNHKFLYNSKQNLMMRAHQTTNRMMGLSQNGSGLLAQNGPGPLVQSELKKSNTTQRPYSAVLTQKKNQATSDAKRRESFTIKKQQSQKISTQKTEENGSRNGTQDLKQDFMENQLQESIENLRLQAQREKEQLQKIQEEKQRELQKLEALKYMTTQIKNPQAQKIILRRDEVGKKKDLSNTQPVIVDSLNESEPQPLVKAPIYNQLTLGDSTPKQVVSEFKVNDEDEGMMASKNSLELVKIKHQFDDFQQIITQGDENNNPNSENSQFQNTNSIIPKGDLTMVQQEQANQQAEEQFTQAVDKIFKDKEEELKRMKEVCAASTIQQQWRIRQSRYAIKMLGIINRYSESQRFKLHKMLDQDNQLHYGDLIIGVLKQQIQLIFLDYKILRHSKRKPSDINQPLNHIFQILLNLEKPIHKQSNQDLLFQLSKLLILNNEQLYWAQRHEFIPIENTEFYLDCVNNRLVDQIEIQKSQGDRSSPLTIADIHQCQQDVIEKDLSESQNQIHKAQQNDEQMRTVSQSQETIDFKPTGSAKFGLSNYQSQNLIDLDQSPNHHQQPFSPKKNTTNEDYEQVFEEAPVETDKQVYKPQEDQFENQQFEKQPATTTQPQLEQRSSLFQNQISFSANQKQTNQRNTDLKRDETEAVIKQYSIKEGDESNIQEDQGRVQQIQEGVPNAGRQEEQPETAEQVKRSEGNDEKQPEDQNEVFQAAASEQAVEPKPQDQLQRTEKEISEFSAENVEEKMPEEEVPKFLNQKDHQIARNVVNRFSFQGTSLTITPHRDGQQVHPSDGAPDHTPKLNSENADIPNVMHDESEDSEVLSDGEAENLVYTSIGQIQGYDKVNKDHILVRIHYNKEHKLFKGEYKQNAQLAPVYFKTEKPEQTILNLQKYLKAFVLAIKGVEVLKVYSQQHEKLVVFLQRKFCRKHYQKGMDFKLQKSSIQGNLFYGYRQGKIFLCVIWKQKRNFYKFENENYRQFVNTIQIRIVNNLKYSDENGVYLLQEPERRTLAQNPQAKLMVIDPEIHKFKQVGWGYLYAIYDAVHKKITLTTDIRKTVAATVDVPKGMTSELLPVYAQELLEKAFIVQALPEGYVSFYAEKDEQMIRKLQSRIFSYQKVREIKVNYSGAVDGQLRTLVVNAVLQKRMASQYTLKLNEQLVELGKLSKEQVKNLIHNLKRLLTLNLFLTEDGNPSIRREDVLEFVGQVQYNRLMKMDMKEFIELMNHFGIQDVVQVGSQLRSQPSSELTLERNDLKRTSGRYSNVYDQWEKQRK